LTELGNERSSGWFSFEPSVDIRSQTRFEIAFFTIVHGRFSSRWSSGRIDRFHSLPPVPSALGQVGRFNRRATCTKVRRARDVPC
jgi:hypothetical protein